MPRLYSIKPAVSFRGRRFRGLRGWTGKPAHPPLTDYYDRPERREKEPDPNSPRILLTELGVGYRLAGENDPNGFGEAARADSASKAH